MPAIPRLVESPVTKCIWLVYERLGSQNERAVCARDGHSSMYRKGQRVQGDFETYKLWEGDIKELLDG